MLFFRLNALIIAIVIGVIITLLFKKKATMVRGIKVFYNIFIIFI